MNYLEQTGMPNLLGGITYNFRQSPVIGVSGLESIDKYGIAPHETPTVIHTLRKGPINTPAIPIAGTEVIMQNELPEVSPIVVTLPEPEITNPIIQQVMTTPLGKHTFKHKNIKVGNMQALLDEAAKYGISFRITSGVRSGAKTKQGRMSHHAAGNAIDITPIPGETYEDLRNKIRNNPGFVKWMQEHGYGIYDETTPEVMARTGASGAHWHIGPDRVAVEGLKQMLI